jgi:hypothetical protein
VGLIEDRLGLKLGLSVQMICSSVDVNEFRKPVQVTSEQEEQEEERWEPSFSTSWKSDLL